jgi:hypothetical protein
MFTATFGGAAGDLSASDTRFSTPVAGYEECQVTTGFITAKTDGADAENTVKSSSVAFPNDQWGQATVAALALGGGAVNVALGIRLRDAAPTADSCYEIDILPPASTTKTKILRTSTSTVLASETSTTWNTGDKVLADVQTIGATVVITVSRIPSGSSTPTVVLSVIDTDDVRILSGQVGVHLFTNAGPLANAELDDFLAGQLVAGIFNLARP